jgi:hypothetical protein
LKQDAYTLHRPAQKRFPRNPYTVNNVGEMWELDLANMGPLASHTDGQKYILNAIEAFSKTSTLCRSALRRGRRLGHP